jgi:hypothetical protein
MRRWLCILKIGGQRVHETGTRVASHINFFTYKCYISCFLVDQSACLVATLFVHRARSSRPSNFNRAEEIPEDLEEIDTLMCDLRYFSTH